MGCRRLDCVRVYSCAHRRLVGDQQVEMHAFFALLCMGVASTTCTVDPMHAA